MVSISRRQATAMGLGGLTAACTTTPYHSIASNREDIAPLLISPENVARIDVGLRPYRRNGFRVEREMFGDKALIHNYGHGGGGVSLSWGTSQLALDLGFTSEVKSYAVIGAGVVGLSTALLLLDRGCNVRIFTKDPISKTTSNVAGAQWWPASVYQSGHINDQYLNHHVEASRIAFLKFQSLVGPEYGVGWEPNYVLADQPITTEPAPDGHPMSQFAINQRDLEPNEHPFASRYVRRFDTMMIDTPHYIRQLEQDVRLKGGEIIFEEIPDRSSISQLSETVIFNCSGLGAKELAYDEIIQPIRGQLVILKPQSEIDYNVITLGDLYMFGRRDGIVLGGTFQEDNWSTEPDEQDTQNILRGNQRLFARV